MESHFINLNNVQTHIITSGNPSNCNGQDVIICITGNPGITDFYLQFASELSNSTGLPICIIGHAGHEEVPDKQSNVLNGQEHLFNLEGQLQHKLDLINNYIDKKSKLHLIGHSIGAWMILELVNNNDNLFKRLSSVNLLFPTLQRMANTWNGLFVNNFLRRIHVIVLFLYYLVQLLPVTIMLFLVEVYLKVMSLPLHYSNSIVKFLNPKVGEKVLFLAYNEMDTVNQLNKQGLDKIKHLTFVIYSNRDGWAPTSYMDDLQQFKPLLSTREVDLDHAFVLKSSTQVAKMVSKFIKTKM